MFRIVSRLILTGFLLLLVFSEFLLSVINGDKVTDLAGKGKFLFLFTQNLANKEGITPSSEEKYSDVISRDPSFIDLCARFTTVLLKDITICLAENWLFSTTVSQYK